MARPSSRSVLLLLLVLLASGSIALASAPRADTARCLEEADLPRVARVRAPDGTAVHARVLEQRDGRPTTFSFLAPIGEDLATVFERASQPPPSDAPTWRVAADELSSRVCAPVRVPQAELEAETAVVVAVGLNYAEHAEEAGGGDVFVFPKPVEPSAPYGSVSPPRGVTLLDYEVELAYVLLADVDLETRPDLETFLEQSAFFVANDITDREAIIRRVGLSPPGTGFVEGKGQPDFLPSGPWMVRGTELFDALERCGGGGLGIRLSVDEGSGFETRQDATTDQMIVRPLDLLEKIASQIETNGLRTAMPAERTEGVRYYPFAVSQPDTGRPILPAGTVIVTGTPGGIAMDTPDVVPLLFRGLLRLRGPSEQFRIEQLARVAGDEPGGFLAAGDRVRASIDGLGSQEFSIRSAGSPLQRDPCD